VVVAFLVTMPLLTHHTMSAIRHIPQWEFDVFAIYTSSRRVVMQELYGPHLLPALRSNVHLGTLVAIKAAMLAEWFAAQNGFGRMVRVYYQTFAMVEFIGWAFLFLVIIGGTSFVLEVVLHRLLPVYRPTAPGVFSSPAAPVGEKTLTGGSGVVIDRLTFGYDKHPLFSHVSVALSGGVTTVLYGPSGCGKTTLLKCISHLIVPWEGTVDTTGKVALVFQSDALLEHRDVLGNVLLPSLPRYTSDDIARARHSLSLWGLNGREHSFPHELSGGMRKRLAFARAWFMQPQVLLLDEPFVNLDREARDALWDLFFLRIRNQDITVLIVTHYHEELTRFPITLRAWSDIIPVEPPGLSRQDAPVPSAMNPKVPPFRSRRSR
jgi:ABC-type nitrate/sulfonate/bicarbonate transport system ATPase subunit